jgi:hypothetical protein
MLASHLKDYLECKTSGEQLHTLLATEARNYRERIAAKEHIIPLNLIEDIGAVFIVTEMHIVRLCDSFLADSLDKWDVAYVCEILDLSESFTASNSDVQDALATLGNPALFGEITPSKCQRLRSALMS